MEVRGASFGLTSGDLSERSRRLLITAAVADAALRAAALIDIKRHLA